MEFHKWQLNTIEKMVPWEKQIYVDLLAKHVKEQNEKARDLAAAQRRH